MLEEYVEKIEQVLYHKDNQDLTKGELRGRLKEVLSAMSIEYTNVGYQRCAKKCKQFTENL